MFASTLSLRASGPATVLSHKCCILVKARPKRTRQSLASTVSALAVAATSYYHPSCHANVVTPCLLTHCLNLPNSRVLQDTWGEEEKEDKTDRHEESRVGCTPQHCRDSICHGLLTTKPHSFWRKLKLGRTPGRVIQHKSSYKAS